MYQSDDKPKLKIRLKQWFSKHRRAVKITGFILLILAAFVAIGLILWFKFTPIAKAPVAEPKPQVVKQEVQPTIYYSPLTGNVVPDEATTKLPVTGVMIENSPDARPQSGLRNSGVVFEAIAEGGITRFLVLYQEQKPQLIGPVRSLRLYDIDWLAPFNASIAHVGGSSNALSEIRNGSYRDIDQFFNYQYYWRSTDRYAPHNVYTSFTKLDALNAAKGYATSSFVGFSRVDGTPSKTPNASSISIVISSDLYNSTYAYDAKTNTYARSQAGAPHLDREDGQICPSVVIAIVVNETTVLEDGFRESITTIGSGNAVIFQNGTATNATWHKDSRLGQISFTDASGKNIPLIRGQVWIAAVPNGEGSISWQ